MSIEDLTHVKVYSASRREQEQRLAPSSVSIITAQDIHSYGWRTLGDALNSLRGFYTAYDRNYQYLGVRGFRESDDYGSRVLLLINGHRINENFWGSIFIGTDFPLDLALVDRIEVVRGPSSSLYGTNAVFAVVNVITREARRTSITTEVSGLSLGGETSRMTAEIRQENISGIVSGSFLHSSGNSRLYFPEFNFPATGNGIAGSRDGDSNAQGFASLNWGDFRLEGLYGSRAKLVPTASFGSNFNDLNETMDTRGYLDVSYRRSLTDKTDLELRGYFDAYRYSDRYAYGGSGAGRYIQSDATIEDWVGTEANLNHRFGERYRVTAGAKYEFNVHLEDRNPGGSTIGDKSPWLAAAYAELEIKVLRSLAIDAGGRIDSYSTFGSSASPRLAVVFSPNSRTSLKYIFGRAFRTPTAYESYYSDGVVLEGNPRLGPEHMLSHDLLLQQTIRPNLEFLIEGYVNTMSELIALELDQATGLQQFRNDERQRGAGLEFELHAKSTAGNELRASYALARARDIDESPALRLPNSPLQVAKLHGSLRFWHARATSALELLYTGTQHSDAGAYVPAGFLANVTVSTKPLFGGWHFAASCYNLLGRATYFPAGPEHRQALIPQDGRTFRASISYTFDFREEKQ